MITKLKTFFASDAFRSGCLVLIVLLLAVNFLDRRIAVSEINTNLERFKLSRLMLNARAQIQVMLLNAALEGRPLNATEIDTVKRVWKDTEYDRAFDISTEK